MGCFLSMPGLFPWRKSSPVPSFRYLTGLHSFSWWNSIRWCICNNFHSLPRLMDTCCSYVLPTVSVNVEVHTSAQHVSFTVMGWLNHTVAPFLLFRRNLCYFLSIYSFPPRVSKAHLSSIVLPAFVTSSFDNSHSTLHGILICASLIVDQGGLFVSRPLKPK